MFFSSKVASHIILSSRVYCFTKMYHIGNIKKKFVLFYFLLKIRKLWNEWRVQIHEVRDRKGQF